MRTVWLAAAMAACVMTLGGTALAYDGNGNVGTNQFQTLPGGVGCSAGCLSLFGGVGYSVYLDEATHEAALCLGGFADGARFDPVSVDSGFGFGTACAGIDPATGAAYFGADAATFRRSDTAGVPAGFDDQHVGASSDAAGTDAGATVGVGDGLSRWADGDAGAASAGGVTCVHAIVLTSSGPIIVGPFCP